MHYYRYIHQLSVQAIPITDIVKNSVLAADVIADPIIGTPLYTILYDLTVYALLLWINFIKKHLHFIPPFYQQFEFPPS